MSAISSIRQVATKRAHGDDKDPSEPPKQQPRLEHFVARLNEAKSESIFHLISRSEDELEHLFDRVPLETLKALAESNKFFQEQIQKHLDHKAQVVALSAAPTLKVLQECGYLDQASLQINSAEDLLQHELSESKSEAVYLNLVKCFNSITENQYSEIHAKKAFRIFSNFGEEALAEIKRSIYKNLLCTIQLKNIRNFNAPSQLHLQQLRADPKKIVSNLVDSFLKVISHGETLFEQGAFLEDVILFDERLKDHLTSAIGFRIDESLTQLVYDKICDDLKADEKGRGLSYLVLYSIFRLAFVGDFLEPNYEDVEESLYVDIPQNIFPFVRSHLDPVYKKRLDSFLKVLESNRANPRVRCGFYLNLSQIFNSFGALDLSQRDLYAKASLEEALKIDEDGIKAKALKQLKIYFDQISHLDLSKRCALEIARLPSDLEEEL